jgi:hypothetical protein
MMNRFNVMINFSAMQGHKIINLFLAIGSLYGTITFYDQLPILAYITFPMVTCASFLFARMVYPYGRILNENAEEFRKSWGLGSIEIYSVEEEQRQDLAMISTGSAQKPGTEIVVVKTMVMAPRNSDDVDIFVPTTEKRIVTISPSKMIQLKYLLKHLRSCRDLKVQMGIFYYFEKSTAVTFMYTAVEYAIMLLLSVDDNGFH